MTADSGSSALCCDDGPAGHTQQQHHDASPCYDMACTLDHPLGGPFPHPEDSPGMSMSNGHTDMPAKGGYGQTYEASDYPPENDCPMCSGTGEITECANDGSHGCSHVHDRTYSCADCNGTGVTPQGDS